MRQVRIDLAPLGQDLPIVLDGAGEVVARKDGRLDAGRAQMPGNFCQQTIPDQYANQGGTSSHAPG